MEFTALWDNVNLASRLEWVNKFYGTYICVSWDVVEATADKFSYRYLDKIRVKWKDTPVVIYELLSRKWCIDEDKKQIVLEYTKAIKFYLDGKFEEAKDIFKQCADKNGQTQSKIYIIS
jgi:adenylate cyclase